MLGWMQILHAGNDHRNSFIFHALEGLRFVFIHCHTTDAPTFIPACFLLSFLQSPLPSPHLASFVHCFLLSLRRFSPIILSSFYLFLTSVSPTSLHSIDLSSSKLDCLPCLLARGRIFS
ncbi:hypothetical protein BO86DRAFT_134264 [Aspergillus japonicus CBS 114.51]|uniref:Uncharacterized protein n=1 Tax=Aspergillus japonicus CBS 114.51 TaxID=1448312 RepID=A0A8T8WW69_ASPJA|nr:hypothetical protein BO86DRAFT_134264 [Aspergillus japonicus CBS 114.51]RAH80075.1 hypothetical protein BO86DRAFT_134264 [Aspergillus japonicus CBS 114.51]